MYKLLASSEFPRSVGRFSAQLWIPHVRKKNSWMKREKPQHVLKVTSCRSGTSTACLHLQRHDPCRSRLEWKHPGVMFRFGLQTPASLEDDPRSRCQRERGGLFFCLIPSPSSVNRVPQLVCKSPQLKYHCLGRCQEGNRRLASTRSSFDILLKATACNDHVGAVWGIHSNRCIIIIIIITTTDDAVHRLSETQEHPATQCLAEEGCPFPHSEAEATKYRVACGAVEMSKSRFGKEDSDSNSPVTD